MRVIRTPVPAGYRCARAARPAGRAGTVRLARGEVLQLVDVEGQQVADLMAWRLADPAEAFSPAHTVSCLTRLVPREGDQLFSTRRRRSCACAATPSAATTWSSPAATPSATGSTSASTTTRRAWPASRPP